MDSHYSLLSDRLILNYPQLSDIDRLIEILNDDIYEKNTVSIPFPYTFDDAKKWLTIAEKGYTKGQQYIFAIRQNTKQEIIGAIDIRIDRESNIGEIGYWLDKKYWNKGYMTEAVKSIIDFGFKNLKLKKIRARHLITNIASEKVMLKAGMTYQSFLLRHILKNGQYLDENQYEISNPYNSTLP